MPSRTWLSVIVFVNLLLLFGCTPIVTSPPSQPATLSPTATAAEALASVEFPAMEPIPIYFLAIHPGPGERLSVDLYESNQTGGEVPLISGYEGARPVEDVGYASRVCVYLDFGPLIQPGESILTFDDAASRVNLEVNGIELNIEQDPYFNLVDSLVTYSFEDNSQQTAESSEAQYLCWPVDLSEGQHKARFTYTSPSGESLSYEWFFELN